MSSNEDMVYYDKYMKYKKKYTDAKLQQEGGLPTDDRALIITEVQFNRLKELYINDNCNTSTGGGDKYTDRIPSITSIKNDSDFNSKAYTITYTAYSPIDSKLELMGLITSKTVNYYKSRSAALMATNTNTTVNKDDSVYPSELTVINYESILTKGTSLELHMDSVQLVPFNFRFTKATQDYEKNLLLSLYRAYQLNKNFTHAVLVEVNTGLTTFAKCSNKILCIIKMLSPTYDDKGKCTIKYEILPNTLAQTTPKK